MRKEKEERANLKKLLIEGLDIAAIKLVKESRNLSWEHCYKAFSSVSETSRDDIINNLALNLAFYLASYGMYRGSAFLYQCDYTVHIEAVKLILKYKDYIQKKDLNKCYKQINGLATELYYHYYDVHQRKLLRDDFIDKKSFKVNYGKVEDYYKGNKLNVSDKKNRDSAITVTLISKILLGSFGCLPAFDLYINNLLNDFTYPRFSLKRVKTEKESKLVDLKNSNIDNRLPRYTIVDSEGLDTLKDIMSDEIKDKINSTIINISKHTKIIYPNIKILDMGLWCAYDIKSKMG